MVTKTEIKKKLAKRSGRSYWEKGVIRYAKELVDDLPARGDYTRTNVERAMLNGASSWKQYSDGGLALIYNGDIAKRLCSPSELKKVDNGRKRPNAREDWLDVQARALYQAAQIVKSCC